MDKARYPLPSTVGAYGTLDQFQRERIEDGQWVFWPDRVGKVLAGEYHSVKPLHVELSPTYLCNFACPWCSCRSAREDWADIDIFNRPDSSPTTVASAERLTQIIENLGHEGIHIQWVGGEPTMHPAFWKAVHLAHEYGLQQCLFTNGSHLNIARARILLDAEFTFIRVSLDAADKEVHRKHHGYSDRRAYGEKVLANIHDLAAEKIKRKSKTLLGLSLVIDDVNVDDMVGTADYVAQLCDKLGQSAIDYMIVRPAYEFYTSQVALSPKTIPAIEAVFGAGATARKTLEDYGVKLVTPPASFKAPDREGLDGKSCLSCGWFSEITPSGDMILCSDRYGNPEDKIGNISDLSLDNIWDSNRRQVTIKKANDRNCLAEHCPGNGRGFHLNKLFHQIEGFRQRGELTHVETWINDLREVLPEPEHPFFL